MPAESGGPALRLRVLFYTTSFTERRGGVEQRYCAVANELVARGAQVRILAIRDRDSPRPKFPLHPSVGVHFAKVGREPVRPLLEGFAPDVLVTVNGRKTGALLDELSGLPTRVVFTEQQNPSTMARIMGSDEARLANLARADRIHVLLPSFVSSLPPQLAARCTVIPNHCTVPRERADPAGRRLGVGGRRRVVFVARLEPEHKRQQLLVEAFARVRRRFEDWDLWLWGDPANLRTRLSLEFLVRRRGLAGRAFLPGPTDDVTAEYLRSHLLVFPAAYEGFPTALLQGMACGLPCVGYAGCAGVNELIVDSVSGSLVPGIDDVPALADAMAALMSDAGRRERYGAAARELALPFTQQRFVDGWLGLLESVVRSPPHRVGARAPLLPARPRFADACGAQAHP